MNDMAEKVVTGALVRSADGKKLGHVTMRGPDRFLIEKGIFFPKEFAARYDDVQDCRDGEVYLRRASAELRDLGSSGLETGIQEETRVPLAEEQVTAEKTVRETGRVNIRKEVRTEQKEVSVPITREEVRVERERVDRPAHPGEATFTEANVSVPIREEKVELKKEPVIREELKVKKTPVHEERVASTTVKREEADIEEEGDVRRAGREDEELRP